METWIIERRIETELKLILKRNHKIDTDSLTIAYHYESKQITIVEKKNGLDSIVLYDRIKHSLYDLAGEIAKRYTEYVIQPKEGIKADSWEYMVRAKEESEGWKAVRGTYKNPSSVFTQTEEPIKSGIEIHRVKEFKM